MKFLIKNVATIFLTSVLLFGVYFTTDNKVKAEILSPAIADIYLKPTQETEKKIKIKNDSMNSKSYILEVSRINPENKSILLDQIEFIKIKDTDKSFSLNPSEEIEITYQVIAPAEVPNGTYFSMITMYNELDSKNVGVRTAIGSIVAIHITDSTSTISDILKGQLKSDIKILSTGDLINPVKLQLTLQNNSNYTVKPYQTLFYIDSKKSEGIKNAYKSDTESLTLYPGKSITKEVVISLWNIRNLTKSYTFVYETSFIDEVITVEQEVKLINKDVIQNILFITGGIVAVFILILIPFKSYQLFKLKEQKKF
jgi:hypothetical protein